MIMPEVFYKWLTEHRGVKSCDSLFEHLWPKLDKAQRGDSAERKELMCENIELLAERMRKDEVEGIICVYSTKNQYQHFHNRLSYEESMGLLSRAAYKLNQEWDAEIKK